jgi:hypothetical protein
MNNLAEESNTNYVEQPVIGSNGQIYDLKETRDRLDRKTRPLTLKRMARRAIGAGIAGGVLMAGVIGLAKAEEAINPSPKFVGEKTVIVHKGDTLDTLISNNVMGSNSFDIREIRYDVINDPENADVLKDKDGVGIREGQSIELPESVR